MVSDTIRAELIYENYPIIAGTDELSVILRLRYVGDLPMEPPAPKQDHSEEQKQQQQKQKQEKDDNNSSWSRRISSQLSNATRAMFLQDLENISEEASEQEDNRLNDISLFLGYTQVFGYYVLNKQIIDFEIFKDLQTSSIIGGKLAGIPGLEIATGKINQSKGLFNGVSNLFNAEITSLGAKDFGEEEDNFRNLNLNSILSSKKGGSNDTKSNAEVIPLYSTTQSILFSDITFKLSEYSQVTTSQDELCRTFYLNLKLPESLPPSFESPSTSIQYSFILGCQLQDLKTGKLQNKTLIFPLKLQSYIDKFARQPLYHLESLHLNAPPDTLKSNELSSPGNKERSNSNFSIFANTNSFINNGTPNSAPSNNNNSSKKLSFRTIKKSLSNLSLNSTASANGSNGFRHQRNSSIGSIVTMTDLAMTANDPLLPSSKNNNSNINNSNYNVDINYSDSNTINTDLDNDTTEADKENISKFLESINKLNDNSVNDVIKIQEEFENNFLDTKASTSLREDLINILADPNSIYRHASKIEKKENAAAADNTPLIDPTIQLEEQIPRRLQTKFGISVNKSLLSNIDLKKVVYKTGDNIPLNISFLNNQANVTGVEIKLIQDVNIYREEYLSKNEYDEPSSYITNKTHIETVLFEKLVSTFNDDQLTLDILIPSNITSQFKTNFFQVKYILEIKFIFLKDKLVETPVNPEMGENTVNPENIIATEPVYEKDKFELVPIFKDGKDQLLYKAVDYLPDAMATIVRLPVIILPNYEQDFGSVSKLS
ncbi:hypothetical protein BVG19_g2983 [[Candida] boidinii]|nr:hypothetical protein BVG19_g2983 [[Candida] boidinii]OWB51966.1 hypothetical protein B5S27_g3537 [[Candida] boidinii]